MGFPCQDAGNKAWAYLEQLTPLASTVWEQLVLCVNAPSLSSFMMLGEQHGSSSDWEDDYSLKLYRPKEHKALQQLQ